MKKVFVLLIVFACLSGCSLNTIYKKDVIKNTTEAVDVSNSQEEAEHQSLTKDTILAHDSNTHSWMVVDLPEVGLKNLKIGNIVNGHSVNRDKELPVYIFCDYTMYDDSIYHDSYLAVVTESKILFKDLSKNGYGSYGDLLYLCDVDGDGIDEIIVHQTVGTSGGAGSYLSRIFKVADDKIQEIFPLNIVNRFDTGFTSVLKDGFKIEISNRFTGYAVTFDYNYPYPMGVEGNNNYFDKSGKVVGDGTIMVDSFCEFVPKDVDGDGVFEIVCKQYVSLDGHTDYIGDAKSVLKFNAKTQKFEVVKAEFIAAK